MNEMQNAFVKVLNDQELTTKIIRYFPVQNRSIKNKRKLRIILIKNLITFIIIRDFIL